MLQDLKDNGLAPQWMTDEGFQMISNGYLQHGETPRDAYTGVAQTVGPKVDVPRLIIPKAVFIVDRYTQPSIVKSLVPITSTCAG